MNYSDQAVVEAIKVAQATPDPVQKATLLLLTLIVDQLAVIADQQTRIATQFSMVTAGGTAMAVSQS